MKKKDDMYGPTIWAWVWFSMAIVFLITVGAMVAHVWRIK